MRLFFFILFLASSLSVQAVSTYYVATNGNNSNPGTIGSPFLTVQKAESVCVAGDVIKLGEGLFNEGIQFFDNAGTSNNLITLDGQGLATVAGIDLDNPWINIVNLNIRGKGINGAQIYHAQNGSHCVISNCDFSNNYSNTISPIIKFNGPASAPFGTAGSFNTYINNRFHDIAAEMVIRNFGASNYYIGNSFLNCDETDVMQVFGEYYKFVGNTISNFFASGANPNHMDFFQTFPASGVYGSHGHLIESNYVNGMGGLGQLGNMTEDVGVTNCWDVTFRNNVFIGVSAKAGITIPGVKFLYNTFIRCSTNTENGGPLLLFFDGGSSLGIANDGQAIGNAFIDCGIAGQTNNSSGTYFSPTLTNVISDYNYVIKEGKAVPIDPSHRSVGDPGGWDTTDWWEKNGINGPVKNLAGVSSTITTNSAIFADYRIGFGSPLIGNGLSSTNFSTDFRGVTRGSAWDIGAYQTDFGTIPPELNGRLIRAYSTVASGAITIYWPTNQYRLNIEVSKRIYTNKPSAWTAWTSLYNLTNSTIATNYIDTAVTNGINYEYQIAQLTSTNYANSDGFQYTDYEYISTAYQATLKDTRGNVILLIATNIAAGISTELTQLRNDLWGDGYKIYEHLAITSEVTAANWKTNITAIKATITNDYNLDPTSDWYLFIIGHVPIPYSGLASPGSHTDNFGANPADWYWADNIESSWTDSTVNNSTADFSSNWNVPGDGKFDPTFIPNVPKIRVSRVDFASLPAFSLTETQLLQQYLNRNHQWRHKQFVVRDLSMIFTNGRPTEAHNKASSMFGSFEANVDHVAWLDKSTNSVNGYLTALKEGSGHYDVDGVSPIQLGTTQDFRDKHLYTVFTAMFGSYYGDWDGLQNSNIVLWAPLATQGYTVATYYPSITVPIDSSSMGEPIGQELFAMAANKLMGSTVCYSPYKRGASLILEEMENYTSLLGDGTVKLKNVYPVSSLVSTNIGSDVLLIWTGSTDSNIQGYHVYRAPTNSLNSLTRLTTVVTTGNSYTNTGAASTGPYTYMVRAVKEEKDTTNRTFFNASQGVFVTSITGGGGSTSVPQLKPNWSSGKINVKLTQ